MTRDEAITTIAHWWADMILGHVWDNGDEESERLHALFRRMMPTPSEADRPALETALATAVAGLEWTPGHHRGWYCDYAAGWLDDVLHACNPDWDSRFCGPQKAGTQFEVDDQGDVTVLAKRGYGQAWVPLEPTGQQDEAHRNGGPHA